MTKIVVLPYIAIVLLLTLVFSPVQTSTWLLIDNFEAPDSMHGWVKADTQNDTFPMVAKPQISERRIEHLGTQPNAYLIKKPGADGIVGNRKALTYKALPVVVKLGEIFTFYTRINVESFPNNHAFGLSNMGPQDIELNDYNAFEATLRVTDKIESNGLKNTGALMVKTADSYANIVNPNSQHDAKALVPGTWYELWYVVNNAAKQQGGQIYDVYIKGGDEFVEQSKVYSGATFRMSRELPLTHFLMNCNSGPATAPYGNGGLLYDDLYMTKGINLSAPNIL